MRENTSSLGPPTPLNGPIKLAPVVRLTEPDGHGWSVGDQLIRRRLFVKMNPRKLFPRLPGDPEKRLFVKSNKLVWTQRLLTFKCFSQYADFNF